MSCVSCTYSLIPPSISFLPPLALDVGPQTSAMDSKVGGSTGIDWAALDKAAAAEKKKLAKVSLVVLDGWILFGLCQLLSFFFFGLIFLYWFHSLSSSSRQLGASVSHHRILTWRVQSSQSYLHPHPLCCAFHALVYWLMPYYCLFLALIDPPSHPNTTVNRYILLCSNSVCGSACPPVLHPKLDW